MIISEEFGSLFLKIKVTLFGKFKGWYTQIQTQMETKVKCLRTNIDLEFVSEQFNEFCNKLRIQRHKTVANHPPPKKKHNDLVERMKKPS